MKKLLLLLLPMLMLSACSSSPNTSSAGEHQSTGSETEVPNSLIDKVQITSDDFWYHFDCDATWNSYYTSEYNDYGGSIYTYTTDVTFTISQVRKGFVTYSGSANTKIELSWKYRKYNSSTYSYDYFTNQTLIDVLVVTQDYETSFVFTKTYSIKSDGYNDSIGSSIPYSLDGNNDKPSIGNKSAGAVNIEATYYKNGVSGDDELTYKSYRITTANYGSYFEISNRQNAVIPKYDDELFDYRISMVINGVKYTMRRDGYLQLPTAESTVISFVEGFIDVYPGVVIA